MLRNLKRCNQQLLYLEFKGCAHISTIRGGISYAKADSIKFQSKIMSKLVGHRVVGSKKRWYPSNEGSTSHLAKHRNAEIFSNTHITKSNAGGGGKNTTRRMAVLNKLFMSHITDLLATGEASEAILGRGLQVTRVKISPDFSCINVYWLGSGDALADGLLETELQRCSGRLRHELSQLMLMSEVPRIKFAREKKFSSVAQVEALLRNIDFVTADEISEDNMEDAKYEKYNFVANIMQREFYGKSSSAAITANGADEEHFPEMRHDVFGLDHRYIMSKLMTKMRKSQQAWEYHSQKGNTAVKQIPPADESLEKIQQKLTEAAEKSEKFAIFLAKRREYRNTPERKKHDRASEWTEVHAEQAAIEAALTPTQRSLLEAEDYLYEEHDKSEHNK
ncbi:uncharacterized protein LOC101449394 [Ceratitis capitata]|uniref:uncharacterized protein LOC101449394 n=1 Tax=Ceratitis capitata TaxID=7213 RepID=UPI00032A01A4|nr:uncharacterized protein LOC101449394 [Ceratitis capitata]